MKPLIFAAIGLAALSFAGCNTVTPTQIATVTCAGATAGAAVTVAVTADLNPSATATTQAQRNAATAQRLVADVCPAIVAGVNAVNAARSSK